MPDVYRSHLGFFFILFPLFHGPSLTECELLLSNSPTEIKRDQFHFECLD